MFRRIDRRVWPEAVVVACAFVVCASDPAPASPSLNATAMAFDFTEGAGGASDSSPGAPLPNGAIRAHAIAHRDASSTSAHALAAYGYLEAATASLGDYSAITANSIGQAQAMAGFTDPDVVVDPGDTGLTGEITFTALFRIARDVSFVLGPDLPPGADAEFLGGLQLDITIADADTSQAKPYSGVWTQDGVDGPLVEPDLTPTGDYAVDVTVELGEAFTIAAAVEAFHFAVVQAGADVAMDASLVFEPAFQWCGVLGLPEGVTITSGSTGVDYAEKLVPAPGGATALALGGVFAARRRRRA